ncbi:MAG: hypothetical protein RL220_1107 [Bacteroidota bacterium]|jgi:hypothetical protein
MFCSSGQAAGNMFGRYNTTGLVRCMNYAIRRTSPIFVATTADCEKGKEHTAHRGSK